MLVARDLLLASCVGDTEASPFLLVARSVCGILGSIFSFRLGVTGRVGDRRVGEGIRVGEPPLAGDVLRTVEPEP